MLYESPIRNIVVEDKRPTTHHFAIAMEGVDPWVNPEKKRDPGDLHGITFQVRSPVISRIYSAGQKSGP